MSRTTFFFVCAALALALAVWITHTRRVAAEVAAQAAKVQANSPAQVSASPAAQVPNNDVEAEPASVPQGTEDAGIPAPAETVAAAITGTLSQCIDSAGKTTIRQSPCPADSKTVKVFPYSVQPNSQTVVDISPPQDSVSTAQYQQPTRPSPGAIAMARCKDAKRYAQNERDRLGLKVTYDQLSSINDIVYDACKSQ
jgi:hypothetical protein